MELIGFFIIVLLIFANGFFVSAEFALVSIRPSRLEELIKEINLSHSLQNAPLKN